MPRITVYDLFPIKSNKTYVVENYAIKKTADHPFYKFSLKPLEVELYRVKSNFCQNAFPLGGFKIGELMCIAAKSPGISKLTDAVEVN